MKKPHYGWLVCAGCALLLFCTSGLSINAFTVYQPYILAQNGFTNAQSSTLITVRSLFSFLSMFLTGAYYRKLPLRWGMALAGGMTCGGFVLFGLAGSYSAYCLAAAAVGLGYGFGTMIPIAIVLEHWFIEKRTFALGICSSITGFSTLGIPSLLTWSVERFGLRFTFLAESVCIALLVLAAALLIRDDPGQLSMTPYGQAADRQEVRRGGAGVLQKQHWYVIVPMLLLLGAMTNVGYSHLTVLASSEGFPAQTAALAITISGIMLTLGKFAFGLVSDRLGTYRSNRIFGALLLCGIGLCCSLRGSTVLLFLAMCLYGTGLATTTVGLSA